MAAQVAVNPHQCPAAAIPGVGQVGIDGVLYMQVLDAARASYGIADYLFAISQLAQTTLRNVIGQSEMDQLLQEREKLNERLQEINDEATEPWGALRAAGREEGLDLPLALAGWDDSRPIILALFESEPRSNSMPA